MASSVVGRFAPSPSGRMHLGNVMSALLCWLSARSAGGRLVLRMEDIDPERSRDEYARFIIEDLRFLGLDWDEGEGAGGTHGPYRQSGRTLVYEEALRRLDAMGLLYPCFCSRAELHDVARAPPPAGGVVLQGPARRADVAAAHNGDDAAPPPDAPHVRPY